MLPRDAADYGYFLTARRDAGHGDRLSGLNLSALIPLSPCHLVRPLLATSRAEIEAYCADARSCAALRPQQRGHDFLPQPAAPRIAADAGELTTPAIREVLAHTAEVMAGEHEVLRGQAW